MPSDSRKRQPTSIKPVRPVTVTSGASATDLVQTGMRAVRPVGRPYFVRPGTTSPLNDRPIPQGAVTTPLPPGPTLVLRNLQYRYRGRHFSLLIDHLELYPGDLTYIGGESGCGKSTLIKILAMETKLRHGNLEILDHKVEQLADWARTDIRGGGITYLSQGHMGLTDNTALDNIRRPLHDFDGLSWDWATQQAREMLKQVGLIDQADKRIQHLSGGQRARVAVAKAAALQRPIWLADEILAALDHENRRLIVGLLQHFAEAGYTIAVVAHQPDMHEYFHRVITLKEGQIIDDRRNVTARRHPITMQP